ncbi:MAG: hypothetical protein K9N10_17060 [Deltaproteobacteria bacterium]|nr:hypothetical protein [Deltaproteobacteria bacterium]
MRTLRSFFIVMACAAVIGIAMDVSARDGSMMGAGGWYQQDQGWHQRDGYGSNAYSQMERNTDGQFDPMNDRRRLNSDAGNRFEGGGSMMGYAPRGGGFCR